MQQDEGFEQAQNGNTEETHQEVEEEETDPTQQTTEEEEDDDDRKLFVGGLSWDTTAKDLKEYFEKFGEVTSCTLKTDLETKKSRGFGFVVYASVDGVDKVCAEKSHELHKRKIDPKRANPRPVNKKIFVGKLDPAITEDEVKTYFETFGAVEKIELPFDKMKDQRRSFCFVEFKKLSAMIKCLEHKLHKIGAVEVEVKKATPPQGAVRGGPRGRGFGPAGRGGRGGGFQGGYNYQQGGYGGGGYGGYPPYDGGYYGYGDYSGYGNYGYGGYGGYQNQWNGGYDNNGGYGGYGQSNFGKAQKRGAAGGYRPY